MENHRINYSDVYMTISIITVCVIMFILEAVMGGTQNTATLIKLGAMNNLLVVAKGQWWRLFTAQFLHIGIWHLVSNIVMIYYMGILLEPMLGHIRFLFVYLVSGIGGNLLSLAFGSDFSVGAGASTALFGLFGVAIAMGVQYYHNKLVTFLARQALTLAIINLVIDIFLPFVDLWGHLGGLITGFLLMLSLEVTSKSSAIRKVAVLAICALIIFVVFAVRQGMVVSY